MLGIWSFVFERRYRLLSACRQTTSIQQMITISTQSTPSPLSTAPDLAHYSLKNSIFHKKLG